MERRSILIDGPSKATTGMNDTRLPRVTVLQLSAHGSTGVIPVQVVCCTDSLMCAPARQAGSLCNAPLRAAHFWQKYIAASSQRRHDGVSDSNGITVDIPILQQRGLFDDRLVQLRGDGYATVKMGQFQLKRPTLPPVFLVRADEPCTENLPWVQSFSDNLGTVNTYLGK